MDEIRWKKNNIVSDNQQMVMGTPCKPEPLILKKKGCILNASGSHIKALL